MKASARARSGGSGDEPVAAGYRVFEAPAPLAVAAGPGWAARAAAPGRAVTGSTASLREREVTGVLEDGPAMDDADPALLASLKRWSMAAARPSSHEHHGQRGSRERRGSIRGTRLSWSWASSCPGRCTAPRSAARTSPAPVLPQGTVEPTTAVGPASAWAAR